METHFETIRLAIATDATAEQRAAGANACRTIAAALETSTEVAIAAPALPTAAPQLAQVLGLLRGVPPDQLLDFAIAHLKAKLPAGNTVAVSPLKFHLLPVPPIGGRS